jgi:LysM repeat protein
MRTGRKLVAVAGAALLLASCGGGGDKKATTTTTPSTQFPTFGTSDPNKIDVSTGSTTPGGTSPVPSTTAGGGPVIPTAPTTAPVGGTTATGPVTDSNVRYKVAAGDTLNSIAKRLGVSVQDLMTLNGITNPNQVALGRQLKVPVPRASTTTTKPGSTTATTKPGSTGTGTVTITGEKVTVAQGDTMVKIAARLGVNVNDLIAANPSVDPAHMAVGTKLNVPAKRSTGSATTTKAGSTTTAGPTTTTTKP